MAAPSSAVRSKGAGVHIRHREERSDVAIQEP
jgi:hypothetical protein